ncbi:hypothetical protein P8452_34332 [Trifolium repens]|nr:Iron-sulfur cluster biosynthesis family protein [Trifolium repens]WJX47668.1 hypothetical protein P8452_34332 [Trifolium repens]
MAFSSTTTNYSPQFVRVPIHVPQTRTSFSSRFSTPIHNLRFTYKPLSIRSVSVPAAAPASEAVAPAISLTDNALNHLNKMRSERSQDLCLRIGVKQGGCSGMSYTMDFEDRANARPDDSIIEYKGFVIVCDPKSLLFVFGMQLDYSDALIGGGFNFKNPNATQTCGCGKSFNAEM